MKIKISMILAAVISTSAMADDAVSTNLPATTVPEAPAVSAPAVVPAPAEVQTGAVKTNAPLATPAKKKPAARRAKKRAPMPELRTVPLVPGPAVVSVSPTSHVNVRGQAKLKSEIVSRLTNGEPVTVIEEIHLKHSGAEEPSAWAKIVMPEKAHTWVHSSFINQTNMTVIPKKLNMRSGPGENFSVIGSLKRGETVKQIETQGDWMQIETPQAAYAFVAAQYLTQESGAVATAIPASPEEPITNATVVAETPTVAGTVGGVTDTNMIASETTNELTSTNETTPTTPVVEEPQPRIVVREGVVRGTFSIQAPTPFELVNMEDHRTINYLYSTTTNLDLSRYKGLHIMVTGQEGLDERWRNTPVLTIQRIQVLD